MKKTLKIFAVICCLVLILALSSCKNWFSFVPNGTTTQTTSTEPPHEHIFADADCVNSKTCECGATEGEALGHTQGRDDGNCTTAVICVLCGEITIPAKEHIDSNRDFLCDNLGCQITVGDAPHDENEGIDLPFVEN